MRMTIRRGFSLVEILVVVAISAILLAISLLSFGGNTKKVGAAELAQFLASELQVTRMRAIGNKTYAGLAFPTEGGAQGLCRSFYTFESLGKRKARKVRQTSNDFPGSDIFVGTWPTSGPVFSLDRGPTALDIPGFDLISIFAPDPVPKDSLLVFTPTGTVQSNGLPLLNGKYHVIVGQGIDYAAGSKPSGTGFSNPAPSYFQMSALSAPWHIAISPTGHIEVQGGVPNAGSGLTIKTNTAESTSIASLPSLSFSNTNSAPQVEKISLSPRAAAGLPTSIEALISQEEYLRLTVEATDPDGDRLTCRWSSSGGTFGSLNQDGAMWYNETSKRWQSTWCFRADPKDLPGKIYDLRCEVRDEKKALGVAASGVQLIQNIELRQKPRFVFGEFPVRGIYTCGMDGSDFQQVPTPGFQPEMPSFHPDGNTILFQHFDWTNTIFEIYSVNRDGSNLRKVVDHPSHGGVYSPDGTQFACSHGTGQLTIVPSCGMITPVPGAPAPFTIPHPGFEVGWASPSFSQDGKRICFQARVAGRPLHDNIEYLFIADVASKTIIHQLVGPLNQIPTYPNGGDNLVEGVYCRDPAYPNLLLCTQVTNGGNTRKLFLMNDDGSDPRDVPVMGGFVLAPAWSKDGKSIVYSNGAGIVSADIDVLNAKLNNEKIILNWDRTPEQVVTW